MRDSVIVGAGYAGLAAARAVGAAGADVVVLEARDRVGGRAWAHREDGGSVDLGGQWIAADHRRVRAAAAEAGLALDEMPSGGQSLLLDRGRVHRIGEGLPPRALLLGTLATLPAMLTWSRLARRVDVAEPWRSRRAEALDGMSATQWIRRHVPHARARAWLRAAVLGAAALDPDDVSMLALLAASGGVGLGEGAAAETTGQWVFADGADALPRRWAAELDVRLGAAVGAIEQRPGGWRVSVGTTAVEARTVIVTVPVGLAARIHVEPGLPAARRELEGRWAAGAATKIVLDYDEPFWREDGLSGVAVDADVGGLTVADSSPPDGSGRLVALLTGAAAAAPASVDDRLVRLFGPRAALPRRRLATSWGAEPWTRDGYGGMPRPGALTAAGAALRAPVDGIHWAGVDTARSHAGYLEGALESAERVSSEVLDELGQVS